MSGGAGAPGGTRPRDPGLQAERTLLSWQRTIILMVGVALLFVRAPFSGTSGEEGLDPLVRVAVALVPVGAAVAATVVLRRRWRSTGEGLHDEASGGPPAPLGSAGVRLLVCAATAVFAVAVAVSALAG